MKKIIENIDIASKKILIILIKTSYMCVKILMGIIRVLAYPVLCMLIISMVSFSLYFTGRHFFQKFKGEYEITQTLTPELYNLIKARGLDQKKSDIQKQAEEFCLLNSVDMKAESKCREEKIKELLNK